MDLYDQEGEYWDDVTYERYEDTKAWMQADAVAKKYMLPVVSSVPTLTPAEKESLLRWEHELSQPGYYDYFLEEVTR